MCFLLGILELKKNIGATILPIGSTLCLWISCSLNPFRTSLHKVHLLHRSLSLFHVCSIATHAPARVPDVSSPVSPVDTTEVSAPKSLQDFRYVYTHRPKFHVSESVLTDSSPVEGPPPQPSAPSSNLDVPIALRSAKVNGPVLIFLFPISFLMIILVPLFASLLCLYLLSLFLGLMRSYVARTRQR